MLRANGFALFRGPDASRLAEDGAARVQRFGRREMLQLTEKVDGRVVVTANLLGGEDTLPVVQGFVSGGSFRDGEPHSGEFAFLARSGQSFVVGRDALGTRPLYSNESGSVVASDHRYFPSGDRPVLLARGESLLVGSMKTKGVRTLGAEEAGTFAESASRLAKVLDEAVSRRVEPCKRVAVSFSGGLDSSLIALLASRHCEVILCSAFVGSSRDQSAVSGAAALLDLDDFGVEVGTAAVEEELRSMSLPFEATPMDKALWALYSTTARSAAAEGAELMLLGQLADELFGGYMKYSIAAKKAEGLAESMMEADIANSAERAFVRDEAACSRFVEPRFPFADEAVVSLARGMPLSYKISAQQRKAVLRAAATQLGLPEELVNAPKKAAQYSSGIGKLVS
ncbi:MAG: asparagine synthase-related protein [Thaumarchaeota archaeon]|nr:asparagine synthase-related protein [Nitrososphaerota archaeon]